MSKIILLVLSAIIISGCSKKNSPKPGATGSISGKWYYVSDTTTNFDVNNVQLSKNGMTYDYHSTYLQFNTDSTGTWGGINLYSNPYTQVFTWSLAAGNSVTCNYPPQAGEEGPQPAISSTSTIKSITANNLVLYRKFNGLNNGNAGTVVEVQYLSR